jgi:hypothetical protein
MGKSMQIVGSIICLLLLCSLMYQPLVADEKIENNKKIITNETETLSTQRADLGIIIFSGKYSKYTLNNETNKIKIWSDNNIKSFCIQVKKTSRPYPDFTFLLPLIAMRTYYVETDFLFGNINENRNVISGIGIRGHIGFNLSLG